MPFSRGLSGRKVNPPFGSRHYSAFPRGVSFSHLDELVGILVLLLQLHLLRRQLGLQVVHLVGAAREVRGQRSDRAGESAVPNNG